MKVLEKAEKGQGLALKLSSLGLIKYQQPMKHTHTGISIFPSLIVKYWPKSASNCHTSYILYGILLHAPISCVPVAVQSIMFPQRT